MTNLAYPIFIWKSHRGLIIFSILVVALWQVFLVNLITTMNMGEILGILLEQLPERFRTFVNEQMLAGLSLKGAAAFGFNHPVVLALMTITAISLPNHHISAEIESGAMELLLAYPINRGKLFLSLWGTNCLLMMAIVGGGLVASLLSIYATDELSMDVLSKIAQIGSNLWLLFVLVMTFTLLFAAFGKEGSRVGMRSAGLTLGFFFVDLLSILWDTIDFIRPFNIFTYYQPQRLMLGQRSFWLNASVLLGLIGLCLLIGVRQFKKRDIPG